jgi:rhamnosyltransferase subunit B
VAALAAAFHREAVMEANAAARVALVTLGSAGDLHPMLALGQFLRERGHPVTLLANPACGPAAGEAGLAFEAIGDAADYRATLAHPKLWHPIDGFGVMWRYLLRPALQPTYERLAAMAAQGRCVVVANPVAMGARVAQEKLGLPLVTAYTAATMLRTVHDPMTLAQWRMPRWVPRPLRRAAWALLDRHKLEPLVRPALDALRAQLGLAPIGATVFGQWMHSPQAGIALFPSWFAPAPPDWPASVRQAGFPLFDGDASQPTDAGITAFLAAGAPPVVFMPGTAAEAAAPFFREAVRACAETGERGLLLGQVPDDLRRALPATLRAAPYAPFGTLLPHTRALVHHGGIGSCAQALRAGIPQLVLPHAYDQFDNAMRLEQLGVGRQLARVDAMGAALRALLVDPAIAAACSQWAPKTTPHAARSHILAIVERLS